MKLNKIVLGIFLIICISFAEDKININFKDLKVMDLVKITSKIIDKNILVTENIKGNVDFISNKPLDKKELVKVLGYVLEAKGYTLIENQDILRIVKLNIGAKSSVPVLNSEKSKVYGMATEIFPVHNANVDYIAAKIRHLLSRDGKLVSNKESNTLVITDFQDNINTIKKVVNVMTYGAKKRAVEIKLDNLNATEAKKTLDSIVKSKFNAQILTQRVDVIANKNNNSLMLVGNRANIDFLKKYIKNIDKKDSLVKKDVKVIPLKNVDAKNVQKILDAIVGKKAYADPNAKPTVSIDEETNSVVLLGQSDELEYVEKLIANLDKEKAQVYVEAKIIEVNDTLVDQIGISYGILGGRVGSKGLAAFSSSLNGGSKAVAGVTTGLKLTIPNITSGLALGASLNLLKQNGALDVVSEPSILAINNQESSIYVGETISVKTNSVVTDGGNTSDNYIREDVGLTLKVKPRISNDTKVTLEITTKLENVKATQTTSGNPDTTKKEIKTKAILNNGESVIIGGLIENRVESTNQKVPLLGDIPLFGELFKNKVANTRKNNLVVIVTPYLIPKAKDITFVRNQLAKLKDMEDRYLADSLVRLKKRAIKKEIEKVQRQKELKKLQVQLDEARGETSKNYTTSKKIDNRTSHQKAVARILGESDEY